MISMRSCLLVVLISVPLLSFGAENLADRHEAKGMNCASCHLKEKPEPFDEVPADNCLKCHPRDVIVAKYANLEKQNPHKNHLGEVDCSICHKGHSESVVYCEQCHDNFKLNIR